MKYANILIALGLLLSGCGGSSGELSGQELYSQPSSSGNTFACETCHALSEPASDGLIRPGHPIGDATKRPSYKNGQVTELLDAVNSCRTDWMRADAWSEGDRDWEELKSFLEEQAPADDAPALAFTIKQPPADLTGGDMDKGQTLFNGRCVVCHGENATGTDRGPSLKGDLLTAELVAARVRTSGNSDSDIYPGLTGGVMPFWSESRLSDIELKDIIAFVLLNEPGNNGGGGGQGNLRDCDETHGKIGQTATLSTFAHGVSGVATIVDDCTIEITQFYFDGQGIDVRFYGGTGGDYQNGVSMSEMDLRRSEGYNNETVYAQLPEGTSLDDIDGISVWCVPVGSSFGDGEFN